MWRLLLFPSSSSFFFFDGLTIAILDLVMAKRHLNVSEPMGIAEPRSSVVRDYEHAKEPEGTRQQQDYQSGEKHGKGKEQFDWWAKEQVDNVAAYAQIKADLQAIREEVRVHFEGNKPEMGSQIF